MEIILSLYETSQSENKIFDDDVDYSFLIVVNRFVPTSSVYEF